MTRCIEFALREAGCSGTGGCVPRPPQSLGAMPARRGAVSARISELLGHVDDQRLDDIVNFV